MTIDHSIFRLYDIRGIAGENLTGETAYLLGRALSTYFTAHDAPAVLVGHDNRESSPWLRDEVIRGLLEGGMRVWDIGVTATPVFYYLRLLWGIDAGVMITASHNPPEYNGFKLTCGPTSLYGNDLLGILAIMEAREFPDGQGLLRHVSPHEDYRDMYREKIAMGPRRLRVVVDCGHGTASLYAPGLFRDLGVDVIPLYCEMDSSFPVHFPDPSDPRNLRDLRAAVCEHHADVGVAFDGDADRLTVVDEQGNIIWGDILQILFWREVMPKFPGSPALVEVKSSKALWDEIVRLGGQPRFIPTGNVIVKAKMRELEVPFAGETSGHMFFADEYFGYDDGLYAAGRLLRILSNTDRTLSQLLADVPRYHATPEAKASCADRDKFAVIEKLKQFFQQQYDVITVDGARVQFPDGWGLVRASNTQPALILRAEAETPAGLARIQNVLTGALARFPEVGPVRW